MNKIRTVKKQSRAATLQMIAGETKSIPTMENDLDETKYVQTIFTSFNRAVVLGGAPLGTMWILHGPTTGGKTAFALGMINSFIKAGGYAAYIDAEFAASKKWFGELGVDKDEILFLQPQTLEQAIDKVDNWIDNFNEGKSKGNIEQHAPFVIVVDTIHKLVPKNELAMIRKDPDKIKSGLGRIRASYIGAWIDHLTPKVGSSDVAFISIAQERDEEKETGDFSFAPKYRVKGGQGLMYDAMVRIRISLSEKIYEASGKKQIAVGKKHNFTVLKNKVGFPDNKGCFFTSNGKGSTPIGFDHVREAVTEAKLRNVIQNSGAWFNIDGIKLQGDKQLFEYFKKNPIKLEELCLKLNNQIKH